MTQYTPETLPIYGSDRLSYKTYYDESTPAEPDARNEEGEQILIDAQVLLIDGEQVFSIETERTDPLADKDLYDAYLDTLKRAAS